jgi:hypothetical protein
VWNRVSARRSGPGPSSGGNPSKSLLGDPGGTKVAGGVTELDAGNQLGPAPFVEASGAEESEMADPVKRVVTVSPMPEGVVLDPAADPVGSPVRKGDRVEAVHHQHGGRQPVGVTPEGVDSSDTTVRSQSGVVSSTPKPGA